MQATNPLPVAPQAQAQAQPAARPVIQQQQQQQQQSGDSTTPNLPRVMNNIASGTSGLTDTMATSNRSKVPVKPTVNIPTAIANQPSQPPSALPPPSALAGRSSFGHHLNQYQITTQQKPVGGTAGKIFSQAGANERAKQAAKKHNLQGAIDTRTLVTSDKYATDLTIESLRLLHSIKEHRVNYTNPRPAPFFEGTEVPMWKIEMGPNVGRDIEKAHAEIQQGERDNKTKIMTDNSSYAAKLRNEKHMEDAAMVMPGTPAPEGEAGATPAGTSGKPKPMKKGKITDTPDIKAARERQDQSQALNRAMGSKAGRYSWIKGAGGSGVGSPLGTPMLNRKKAFGLPGTPTPQARGTKRPAQPDAANPAAKRQKASEFDGMTIEDTVLPQDFLTMLSRMAKRSPVERHQYERHYQGILVEMAVQAAKEEKEERERASGTKSLGALGSGSSL